MSERSEKMEKAFVKWLEDTDYLYDVEPYTGPVYLNCFLEYWSKKFTSRETLWEAWPKQAAEMITKIKSKEYKTVHEDLITEALKESTKIKFVAGPWITHEQSCNGGYLEMYLAYTVTDGTRVGNLSIDQTVYTYLEFKPMDINVKLDWPYEEEEEEDLT